MVEIIFEVQEDEIDGGYIASALGFGIHTDAETLEELRINVREAVECHFDNAEERPSIHYSLLLTHFFSVFPWNPQSL